MHPTLASLTLQRYDIATSADPATYLDLAIEAESTLDRLSPFDSHTRKRFASERDALLTIAAALETIQHSASSIADPVAALRQINRELAGRAAS